MADYTAIEGSDLIRVRNSAYFFGWNDAYGYGVQVDNGKNDARLRVEINDEGLPDPSEPGSYTVMDSDYDTYSIVYTCESIWYGFASREYLWVLAREPEISNELLQQLSEKIEETLPDYEFWENTVRTVQGDSCAYDERPPPLE